jgi:hypothetical protein
MASTTAPVILQALADAAVAALHGAETFNVNLAGLLPRPLGRIGGCYTRYQSVLVAVLVGPADSAH